jgi:hypothetical protein
MRNLNLSKDALDFLTALSQERAKPVWKRIKALLEGPRPAEVIDLGEGFFSATVGEFQISLRFDDSTVHVDHISVQGQAPLPAKPNAVKPQNQPILPPPAQASPKIESDAPEFFALIFVSLLFALSVNRWFGHDFILFGAFGFAPLIACFSGFAIGVNRPDDRFFKFASASLLITVLIPLSFKFYISTSGLVGQAISQLIQGGDFASLASGASVILISLALMLCGPFALMSCLGSRVARLFNQRSRLTPYGTFITALLCGYLTFQISTAASVSPAIQLLVVACILAALVARKKQSQLLQFTCLLLAGLLMFTPLKASNQQTIDWSPYHEVEVSSAAKGDLLPGEVVLDGALGQSLSALKNYSQVAFLSEHPKTVLILGAGIGAGIEDILRKGATSIDAVEVDPVLLKIGRRLNASYNSPLVNVHLDDPRRFVNDCQNKYDLILFPSQNFVNWCGASSLDQGNYLRTLECYKKCLAMLDQNGIMLLSFATSSAPGDQALRDAYYATATEALGHDPLVVGKKGDAASIVFILGETSAQKKVLEALVPVGFDQITSSAESGTKAITDDYPYVSPKTIQPGWLYLLWSILLIGALACFARYCDFFKDNTPTDWQLFLLGAAFALMICGSLPRLFALFGSTWLSSAIIFSGMLAIAWLANYAIHRPGAAKFEIVLYFGLAVSLLISYFLPVRWLLRVGPFGVVLVVFFTILPVFRVLLMLAASYSEAKHLASSIAFTLLGLSGGLLLTHLSVYFGQNNLILASAVLFGGSFVFYARSRKIYPSRGKLATKRIT